MTKVVLCYGPSHFEEKINEMDSLGYDLISWKLFSLADIVAVFKFRGESA